MAATTNASLVEALRVRESSGGNGLGGAGDRNSRGEDYDDCGNPNIVRGRARDPRRWIPGEESEDCNGKGMAFSNVGGRKEKEKDKGGELNLCV